MKLGYTLPTDPTRVMLVSNLEDKSVKFDRSSKNLRFAAAVAEFGMLLRDSKLKGFSTYEHVLDTAKRARGSDAGGFRNEFIKIVEAAQLLSRLPAQ